jgi:hypothetical protein
MGPRESLVQIGVGAFLSDALGSICDNLLHRRDSTLKLGTSGGRVRKSFRRDASLASARQGHQGPPATLDIAPIIRGSGPWPDDRPPTGMPVVL